MIHSQSISNTLKGSRSIKYTVLNDFANAAKDAVILDSLYLNCTHHNENLKKQNDYLAFSVNILKNDIVKAKDSIIGIQDQINISHLNIQNSYKKQLKKEKRKKWYWAILVAPVAYLVGGVR